MTNYDYTWLDPQKIKVEGHMRPGPEALEYWTKIKQLTGFKSLMEIGFNAGHSSAFILDNFNDVKIHSYDIGWHKYTKTNADKVKQKYGNRFDYTEIDSKKIEPKEIQFKYDLMYIDGDHAFEGALSDIQLFVNSTVKWAIVDDTQITAVSKAMRHPQFFNRIYKLFWEGKYIAHPKGNEVKGALIRKL